MNFNVVESLISSECPDNEKLNVLGNHGEMAKNGWRFDFTHAGKNPSDEKYKSLEKKCGTSNSWYGWSEMSKVGTLSTILSGGGKLTIDFGNCGSDGYVKVYLDSIGMVFAPAAPNEIKSFKSHVIKSFFFKPGSLLEIKEEGSNSVIRLNSITFECNHDNGGMISIL